MRQRPLTLLALVLSATAVTARAGEAPPERPPVPVLRDTLRDTLSSGYQLTEPPQARLHEMLVRALRALRDLLGHAADVNPLSGLPLWAKPVLAGVLLALLGLMIAHIVRSLRALLTETRERRSGSGAQLSRRDPRSVLRSAEEALQRGEYDVAVRLLYLAVLLRLDRLGVLSHDPARTNWENLGALAVPDADTRDAMALLTREVDACVYGGRSANPDTWERARGWADVLWQAERPT